jgi:pyridoxal phosphate enzyme (YggS family)
VAISKTHPINEITKAYDAGQRVFGENKVQELVPKYTELPKDIKWHFVGHLQSNKVKYIASFIDTIHSVDSLALLKEIDKYAHRCNRTVNVLLQVHIAREETKFGFNEQELLAMLETPNYKACSNVSVCGLMGMATLTEDTEVIRSEFKYLASLFKKLKETQFSNNPEFCELSMGMSSDCELAIEEGSTMVRVGSKIFGERDYSK